MEIRKEGRLIRDELRRALETLGGRMPGRGIVLLVRRGFGDHGVAFLQGDVERITGHSPRRYEAPTREWVEIVHPSDRDTVLERLGQLPEPDRLRLEYRVRRPEGGVRWIREDLSVRRPAPGSPPEVVGLLTDVTAQRTAQGRLSRLEAELWRSRKMEAVGKVATEVAHDFNNLLTAILASADLLRHDPELPDDAREETRIIRDSAVRGRDLVRKILAFASRLPGGASVQNLSETVTDMEAILSRIVPGKVTLEMEIESEEACPVLVDRAHLEQVVLNLVDNAGEAMPTGGRLSLGVRNLQTDEAVPVEGGELSPGEWVELTVRDTGTGISDEARDRVFEPFFSTKVEREGSGGFGLATVMRIVQSYGGGVRIESELDRGTAFRVFFPVSEEGVAGARDVVPPESGAVSEAGDASGLRILVLDDDEEVRGVVERILVREGHTVATVGSAAEAVQVFDRLRPPFDLLVADVMLPDRTGPEVHRALERRVGDLPVVFISGYGPERAAREGVLEAEERFLEKPFAPGDLVRIVDQIQDEIRAAEARRERDRSSTGDAGG